MAQAPSLVALGVVYIMDHEVALCSSKICDWPLNSSCDHCDLHQERETSVRVTMEYEVLKRPICRPTLSIVMVQPGFAVGEVKEGFLAIKDKDYDKEMPFRLVF